MQTNASKKVPFKASFKNLKAVKASIVRKSFECGYTLNHANPTYQNLSRIEALKAEVQEASNQLSECQKMIIDTWVNALEKRYAR